jgi:dihydrofolate reductase
VGRLVYSAITSLDGYVADESGSFDWAAPDDEVHRFVNDQERAVGTYLYGRRMYDVMTFWQDADLAEVDDTDVGVEYAHIWRAADKVVFSRTLEAVTTPRTRLESSFDAEAVRRLVLDTDRDVSIGGPTLAAEALRAGLVDDVHLFLNPVVVGGGTPALPTGVRLTLELVDEHRFSGGVVHLHHRVVRAD